jgi:hypothetical protein
MQAPALSASSAPAERREVPRRRAGQSLVRPPGAGHSGSHGSASCAAASVFISSPSIPNA